MSDSILAHIAQEANSLMLRATDPQVVDLARLVRMLADATGGDWEAEFDEVDRRTGDLIRETENDVARLSDDLRAQVLDHEDLGRTVDNHARRLDALERGTVLD